MISVVYNGVVLRNVLTRDWDQEIVYDESHTDWLFSRFKLRFEGVVYASDDLLRAPAFVAADPGRQHPAEHYEDIRRLLAAPRCALTVYQSEPDESDPRVLLYARPADSPVMHPDCDVDGGPKPQSVTILQIAGARCLRVAFAIHVAKLECRRAGDSSGPVPWVLNNRWSITEEMDPDCFITRTIAGTLRLSAPVSLLGSDFRGLTVPGLERGFRRDRIEFTVDKSGLACQYRVVDRQVHTAAPWPATRITAQHTESTNDGITFTSEVNCRLEGPPHADKRLMITRAVQVLDAKLKFLTREAQIDYIVEHAAIIDHIGEANAVEARLRITQMHAKSASAWLAQVRKDTLGKPLELPHLEGAPAQYHPAESMVPKIYGYVPHAAERRPSILLLLQCYLQQPCSGPHGLAQWPGSDQAADDEESRKRYKPEVYEAEEGYIPNSPGDEYSDTAREALYTHAALTSRYIMHRCRAAMPIAKAEKKSPGEAKNKNANDKQDDTAEDTCAIVTLAPGICYRVLRWDVERAGQWPEIPEPAESYNDGGLRGTLLTFWIEPHPPTLAADGARRIYRVSGEYVYALSRPPQRDEKWRVGVLPFTKYEVEQDEAKFDASQAYTKRIGP